MEIWSSIINEIINDNTIVIICFFILTSFLAKYTEHRENKRILSITLMIFFHIILTTIAGLLLYLKSSIYSDIRLASLILAAMSTISMSGILIFKILLPKLKVHPPMILQDLIVAGSSIIAFFILASRTGYNLSGLVATSAVITAVVGFSLQDSLINIMGGLAIQLDNSIKVGDWIKVDEKTVGKVIEVRWRYTSIETSNWETIIIPNITLIKNPISVLGKRINQPNQLRRWIYFNVDFRYSPREVIKVVLDALDNEKIDNISTDPPISCILMDIKDTFGHYAVRYWLTNLAKDDPTDSEVRIWIYYALKRANIPLSMPAQAVFVTEDSSDRKERKSKEEIQNRISVLEKIELFNHLTIDDLEKIATKLRYAPFTRGEVITRQGAEAHWLYIIIKGQVSIQISNYQGETCEVAKLKSGSFFGEMSLMTGEKRSATVVAISDTDCYRIDKSIFQEIIEDRPDIAEVVAEILAKRKAELELVRDNLNHEEHKDKIETHKNDILRKIRDFFGLNDSF